MIMKNKLLPILALLCFACFGMAKAQSTLTVYDGDASSVYIPVYGFYADAYQKVEMIMHSDDLSVMTGGTIDNMTWFLSTPAEAAWGGNFKIYLKEVDATTTAPRVQSSLPSTQTGESLGSLAIEISRGNSKNVPSGVIDRAIIRFDEGEALPKLQMNDNSTRISITQDGEDYAVINLGRDAKFCVSTTEIPISFKAAENGVYTLSISAPLTSNLSPLTFHLIDTLTGSDIDLLSTPTYTFEAKVTDDVNRFKLVFATK